jgi:hypothetical protein
MAKYNTTITKKDGTTAAGYIDNNKSYYADGSETQAGDSVTDQSGRVWTKPDTAASSGTTGTPDAAALISQAIKDNNPTGTTRTSYYSSSGAEKPTRSSYLRSSKELADLYDINYDMDYIRGLYDDATTAKYDLLSKEAQIAENQFYQTRANSNATLLDTLKKAASSAIATGASRGLAGAEQLGLMMEAQKEATAESTKLAQDRALMADKIASEKAQNIIDALEASNKLKQDLAGISTNVYSADTQYDVAELDYAAQMRNVEALFEQIAAEEDINRRAQWFGALEALLGKQTADADRASREKIAADENATQQAYYNSLGSGSSSGYGKTIDEMTPEELYKFYNEAYSSGNQHVAAMYAYKMGMWDSVMDAFEALGKDSTFNKNKPGYQAPTPILNNTNTKSINNTPKNINDVANNVQILRNIYSKYGKDSKEFKEAYEKADTKTKTTFDNNYR